RARPAGYELEHRLVADAEGPRDVVRGPHGQDGDRHALPHQLPRHLAHRAVAAGNGNEVGLLRYHVGPVFLRGRLQPHGMARLPDERLQLAGSRPAVIPRVRIVNQRDFHGLAGDPASGWNYDSKPWPKLQEMKVRG